MPDDSKPGRQGPRDSTSTDTAPPSTPAKTRRIRPLYVLAAAIAVTVVYVAWTEIHNRLNFIHEEDARIHADLVTVSSRVAGWITEMPIAEGDELSQGAVMVQVDDRESNIQLNELEAQLAASGAQRNRLAAERILVSSQIESRMQSEKSQVAAADVAVSSLRPQLELAKRELNRTQRLFEDKVASRRQLDQAENQLQQIDREYRIAVAALEAAKSGMAEAEADRARLGVLAGDLSVLESREQEIKARIERQRLDIQDRTVKSPTDGVVDRIFVDIGEYVTPGQRLALVHNQDLVWGRGKHQRNRRPPAETRTDRRHSCRRVPRRCFQWHRQNHRLGGNQTNLPCCRRRTPVATSRKSHSACRSASPLINPILVSGPA